MQAHHTKAILDSNGGLHIDALPFSGGETVEVIVLSTAPQREIGVVYPLLNTPVKYVDPFEPIGDADWESSR